MTQVFSKDAEPTNVEQIDILSNIDPKKSVSIMNGFAGMTYTESIMSDTVRVKVSFIDSGDSIDDKTVTEGLPLVGQEQVKLKFSDNNENTLEVVLYVNKITPNSDRTQEGMMTLDLVSKEFIMNEKKRVNQRFDGKVSDHINKLMTDQNYLGTAKTVNIEKTSNLYNFFGNNKKPLYTINWLSKKAIPADTKGKKSAGFFFYETYTGYHFRSIEGLLKQDEKKRIVYNETTDSRSVPKNYDVKAADYQRDSRLDVREKFKIGTYKTRLVTFDPFTTFYKVDKVSPDNLTTGEAAKSLPTMNPEFESPDANREFSRTLYSILDTGTLPTGDSNTQIKKSGEEISYPSKHSLPSIMRYNQLFTSQVTVTIPGDFSLHAGDAIFLDMAELVDNTSDKVNSEQGGLYIISDLCHYISPDKTYTKMNLVRDAYGRKAKSRN